MWTGLKWGRLACENGVGIVVEEGESNESRMRISGMDTLVGFRKKEKQKKKKKKKRSRCGTGSGVLPKW